MIITKSRLIIGLVTRIIKGVFKAIYSVLSIINLQWTLLALIVGIILYFTGVLNGSLAVRVIFFLLFTASVFYAIIATIGKMLGLGKKKKNSVQIVKEEKRERLENDTDEEYGLPKDDGYQKQQSAPSKPTNSQPNLIGYFKVKQNPNYLMAEYTDRYELFYLTSNGMKKVRTDYKK